MKKFIAILFVPLFVLSLASCQVNHKSGNADDKENADKTSSVQNDNGGSAQGGTKPSTTVDYSKVLKKLNKKETKFVDSLGKTEKGKKIVAFFGDEFEIQFIVAEFKDGKVSKVKNYRFFEEDSKYQAYKIIAEHGETGFVDHENEKCIEQIETKKYRGKTYDEMVELLHGYDYKR